jgi:hypothetical protein
MENKKNEGWAGGVIYISRIVGGINIFQGFKQPVHKYIY